MGRFLRKMRKKIADKIEEHTGEKEITTREFEEAKRKSSCELLIDTQHRTLHHLSLTLHTIQTFSFYSDEQRMR
jgi:hypothetical protein